MILGAHAIIYSKDSGMASLRQKGVQCSEVQVSPLRTRSVSYGESFQISAGLTDAQAVIKVQLIFS
jgi:hypothetical protein